MLYDQINNELQRINDEITTIEKQLKHLPTGSLICTKNGKYTKWYNQKDSVLQYIKKSNLKLAEDLAVKKYLALQLQDLLHEKQALTMYINHHEEYTGQASKLLSDNPAYQALLATHFSIKSKDLQEWASAEYEKNTKYPEQLIHKSISGNIVRSKSEVLIDMALYQNNIPFRYECPLILDELTIYPDFTIRHPVTGKQFYWEHFGLMDSPQYAKNVSSKLQLYISNSLIPSIDLITTYETTNNPLTMDNIMNLIHSYFL